MVTVHRAFGFRFVIYGNDHSPPHLHLVGQGGEAKVVLLDGGGVMLDWSVGIAKGDLRRLLQEVASHHADLYARWESIH